MIAYCKELGGTKVSRYIHLGTRKLRSSKRIHEQREGAMGVHILLADDDPDNLSYLKNVLEDEGYEALTARDGVEGMEKVRLERPQLVLLDLMMPNKSGIKMFQEMKIDEELREIPVIIVTGVSQATGVDFRDFAVRPPGGEGDPLVTTKGERRYSRPSGYLEKAHRARGTHLSHQGGSGKGRDWRP